MLLSILHNLILSLMSTTSEKACKSHIPPKFSPYGTLSTDSSSRFRVVVFFLAVALESFERATSMSLGEIVISIVKNDTFCTNLFEKRLERFRVLVS